MPALLALVAAMAVAAWLTAAASALSIIGLAPAGTRFSTLMDLGWWRLAAIEGRLGPQAQVAIGRYRKAFFVFFACILGGILASFVAISTGTASSG